eukprot:GHVP01009847.1.p1 GENE.GHVP01009847.1~~GHVP01009847.1.p1  ORF type:complete len:232 (-),score=41.61 GHVP01009847.1:21-716(-)
MSNTNQTPKTVGIPNPQEIDQMNIINVPRRNQEATHQPSQRSPSAPPVLHPRSILTPRISPKEKQKDNFIAYKRYYDQKKLQRQQEHQKQTIIPQHPQHNKDYQDYEYPNEEYTNEDEFIQADIIQSYHNEAQTFHNDPQDSQQQPPSQHPYIPNIPNIPNIHRTAANSSTPPDPTSHHYDYDSSSLPLPDPISLLHPPPSSAGSSPIGAVVFGFVGAFEVGLGCWELACD